MKQILSLMLMTGVATCLCAQSPQSVATPVLADTQFKVMSVRPMKQDVNAQVLDVKHMPDGRIMQVVKDSKGRIYKRNAAAKKINLAPRFGVPMMTSTADTFSENFESWTEDLGFNWIPDGWREINTPENTPTDEMLENNVNNTWYTYYTGDGYWTPMTEDGANDCFIHFTYSSFDGQTPSFTAAPQDEWLITPIMTPGIGEQLMFSAAIDLGMLVYYDWGTGLFDRNTPVCNLEVLASTDNGENWTHLWDAWNDMASQLSDQQLSDHMLTMVYYNLAVNISEYVGKDVQFAFRYTTYKVNNQFPANSVAIDAVKVAVPQAEAYYAMPYGTLYAGLSKDLWTAEAPTALMPAYTSIHWESLCNEYATNVEWTFVDELENTIKTDELEPITEFPYALLPAPSLTASNDLNSSTYIWGIKDPTEDASMIQYGGAYNINTKDGKVALGFGNYDYNNHGITTMAFDENSFCFGTDPVNCYDYPVTAIGNFFAQPASPLYTDGLFLTFQDFAFDVDDDAEIYANIYELDEYGSPSQQIATAKANVGDKYTETGFITVPFEFYTIKNGEEVPATFLLDRNVLVEITGFYNNPKVRKFGVMSQYENHTDGLNYAYVKLHIEEEGYDPMDTWFGADELIEDCVTSLAITFTGAFDYIHPAKSTVTLPAIGGNETVAVDSYFGNESWTIVFDEETSYPLTSAVTLDDWLTITPSADGLTFSAEASQKVRSMMFVIDSNGAKTTMTVKQGQNAGIDAVEVSDIAVKAADGQILISGADAYTGQTAHIYNESGILLGSALIDNNGSAAIYTTNTRGTIIIKVGDKSIKAIQ